MNREDKNIYLKEIEDLKTDNAYMKGRLKTLENQIWEANMLLKDINDRPAFKVIFKNININSYLERWNIK